MDDLGQVAQFESGFGGAVPGGVIVNFELADAAFDLAERLPVRGQALSIELGKGLVSRTPGTRISNRGLFEYE